MSRSIQFCLNSIPVLLAFFATAAFAEQALLKGSTSITAIKSAEVTVTETQTFTWTIEKVADTPELVIAEGETKTATFTITATRTGPAVTVGNSPVTGEVCVTNTGKSPTRGLRITDQLEVLENGDWTIVAGPVNLPISSEIEPGDTACFPYEFSVEINLEKQYRNHAIVTIDNFVGAKDGPHGIDVFADLTIRSDEVLIDDRATITDAFECPPGFTCAPLTDQWVLTGTDTLIFETDITNDTVECDQTVDAVNRVTLVPSHTGVPQMDFATVEIYTEECPVVSNCPVLAPDVRCAAPETFTFQSAQNGNWATGATWVGGVAPSANVNNQRIRITHDVTMQNGNISLSNNAIIYITEGGRLTLRNGNLEMQDGNQATTEKILLDGGALRTSGNVQQSGTATVFCANRSLLEIGDEDASLTPDSYTSGFFNTGGSATSANFQNTSGFRRIENSCLNVTQSFQNSGGTDQLIGVCGDIGDRGPRSGPHSISGGFDGNDSGNWDMSSATSTSTTVCLSEIYLPNGNVSNSRVLNVFDSQFRLTNGSFSNQSSGTVAGENIVIWINHPSSGNIINSGVWPGATITAWRTDNANNPTGFTGLPPESSQADIDAHFTCRPCSVTMMNATSRDPLDWLHRQ